MSIRFRFDGPVAAGFDAIGRELQPGEEFDVDEHLALAFANHGHCVCLEPDKLRPLRDAEQVALDVLVAERAAAGLVDAHPAAQAAAAARAATASSATAVPAAAVPAAVPAEPAATPAPKAKRGSTTDLPAAAE